jgi:hypothetical protein
MVSIPEVSYVHRFHPYVRKNTPMLWRRSIISSLNSRAADPLELTSRRASSASTRPRFAIARHLYLRAGLSSSSS